jgi:hypothetical protein
MTYPGWRAASTVVSAHGDSSTFSKGGGVSQPVGRLVSRRSMSNTWLDVYACTTRPHSTLERGLEAERVRRAALQKPKPNREVITGNFEVKFEGEVAKKRRK